MLQLQIVSVYKFRWHRDQSLGYWLSTFVFVSSVCYAFFDNMGVVKHGRLPAKALSETQVQSDILGHIKYLLLTLSALELNSPTSVHIWIESWLFRT